jgi:hypothetical protein
MTTFQELMAEMLGGLSIQARDCARSCLRVIRD